MIGDWWECVTLQLIEHAADAELALAERKHEPPQLRRGAAGSLPLHIQRINADSKYAVKVLGRMGWGIGLIRVDHRRCSIEGQEGNCGCKDMPLRNLTVHPTPNPDPCLHGISPPAAARRAALGLRGLPGPAVPPPMRACTPYSPGTRTTWRTP